MELLSKVLLNFIPFLFSLCFHEFAHGWVAQLKGDPTARMMGRLNLNPLSHADPIGTFVFPIMGFVTGLPFIGWAKPVPVDERNLKDPLRDMFWIAAAGPASNILLAAIGGVLRAVVVMKFLGSPYQIAMLAFLDIFMVINLFLAFFNLIPVHPLDGGKVIARFLPIRWNRWLEENQQVISLVLMVLVFIGGFRFLAEPVYWTHGLFMNVGEKIFLW